MFGIAICLTFYVESKVELGKQLADTKERSPRNEKIRREEALWFSEEHRDSAIPLSLRTGCFIHYLQIQQLSKTLKTPAFICAQYQRRSIFSILVHLCIAASAHSCSTAWGVWGVAEDETLALRQERKGEVHLERKHSQMIEQHQLFAKRRLQYICTCRWSQTPYLNSSVW